MRLTTRIAKEEVREQARGLLVALAAQDMPKGAQEYLAALVIEEMDRIANHAFSAGRLFERRNPLTP